MGELSRRRHRGVRRIGRLAAIALSLTSGCAGTTGHLAAVSTRTQDLAYLETATAPPVHIIGRSCIEVVVVVPMDMPNLGGAVEDALRTTDRQVLTDVTIGYTILYL